MSNPNSAPAARSVIRCCRILGPLLACLAVTGICSALADGGGQGRQVPPPIGEASVAPAPVTPGRPHASSMDPHQKLPAEKMVQIALQHKEEGRPQEAMKTLSMAIARYPDNAELYSVRGSLYLEQAKFSTALQDLERSLALNPDDAAALTNRAQAYRQFGRVSEAMSDLDRAVALKPNLIPALFNRGALRYSQGDLNGAREDFERCIAADPHMPAPYFNRAAVNDALGDRSAAIADIERFIQIAGKDTWRQQAEELLKFWTDNPSASKEPASLSKHRSNSASEK